MDGAGGPRVGPLGRAEHGRIEPWQQWPLVGRTEELRFAIKTLSGREPRSVVLAGPAGVGKSRLAIEVMSLLRQRGWATKDVLATKGAAAIPFGALSHLLRADGSAARGMVDLLGRAERSLLGEAESRRVALLVDDAHLLDPGSAALVHQLVSTRATVVLATVTSGVVAPDPVTALWKEELASRLDLQPLAPAEVESLLTEVLGGHIEGKTLYDLIHISAGNVLYLRELVHAGQALRALTRESGIWRWTGPITLQGSLLDLIQDRFWALDRDQRELLTGLASGEPLELPILQSLGSDGVLRSADASGLLTIFEQGRRAFARVAHPLYAEALRQQASPLRVRALSARLADAIQNLGGRRVDDPLRIAILLIRAGQRLPAELALTAGHSALELGDYELAERIVRLGFSGGRGFEGSILLAETLIASHRESEAEELLAALEPDDEVQISLLADLRAFNLAYGLDRASEASTVLESAEARIGVMHLRDELEATRALLLAAVDMSFSTALALASTVIEREAANPQALPRAYAAAIVALWATARPESAIRLADRGIATLAGTGGSFGAVTLHVQTSRFAAFLFSGLLDEAAELATRAYAQALEARSEQARAYWAMHLGEHALWSGRVMTSINWLREAELRLRNSDPYRMRSGVLSSLALAASFAHDLATAASAIGETESPGRTTKLTSPWTARARGWHVAVLGNFDHGRAMLMEAAIDCRNHECGSLEALLMHDIARLGDPGATSARLSEIAVTAEGPLFVLFATHAAALAAEDAEALELAAESFRRMGLQLEAAEAFASAAQLLVNRGIRGRARLCQYRAHTMLALCEGARTPGLANLGLPEPLSKREQEIGILAARGLTNHEIARKLGISGRTVDNHLQHVFDKLDLHSRTELATVFGIVEPVRPESGLQL
jgi:DNA-binding CsgD family transcriptional regulator